jgi:citrate synthase
VSEDGFANQYWTAKAACDFLGIKPGTLYAYVSRGLVQSTPTGRGLVRLYRREDLDRLKARHDARKGHGPVAAGALRFGEPVLETKISRIGPRGPEYRGTALLDLVDEPYERVADRLFGAPGAWPPIDAEAIFAWAPALAKARPLERFLALVPLIGLGDPDRHATTESAELHAGRRLVRALAVSLALPFGARRTKRAAAQSTIAETIAIAWLDVARPKAIAAIDRALVVSADHELNPSTFAARIAASTGADLYAALTAAFAALSGPKHGAACDRVERFLEDVGAADRASSAIRDRAQRGEAIPGFGHPLYPDGDPRTAPLLELATQLAAKNRAVTTANAIVKAMSQQRRGAPTIDFGLVPLAAALGLPSGSASALFGLGRTAGWIAHAIEQRTSTAILRPRARYVG